MKIMHIMAGRGQGGAEIYSTDVMLSLHRAGVEQIVVIAKDAPRYADLCAASLSLDVNALAAPFTFLQRMRIRKLIKHERPDIVQCWMRRAASVVSKPTADEEGWRTPQTIGWFGGYYEPKHFRSCRYFVGVTRDIVAHMIKKGVREDRAYFIPTFPDITSMPALDRRSVSTPKEAKVILALSRLHPKKGLDTLLKAVKTLPDYYLWLAGEGPDRHKLENLSKKLGIEDRVRFMGWRTDRSALLHAADVCALPSRYEPFGTVILEAWAAGVPLVACKSAGPAAHVKDGENGLLVPVDDVSALTLALRRATTEDDLRRRLIANGYATYSSTYTRESITQQWIELYQKIHINAYKVEKIPLKVIA